MDIAGADPEFREEGPAKAPKGLQQFSSVLSHSISI